jgi:hypothetical protein
MRPRVNVASTGPELGRLGPHLDKAAEASWVFGERVRGEGDSGG